MAKGRFINIDFPKIDPATLPPLPFKFGSFKALQSRAPARRRESNRPHTYRAASTAPQQLPLEDAQKLVCECKTDLVLLPCDTVPPVAVVANRTTLLQRHYPTVFSLLPSE